MSTGFRDFHPLTGFTFYILIFIFSLTATHPLCLAAVLLCGLFYDIKLHGKKALSFLIKVVLPFMLLALAFNGIVNPRGETQLFTFPWGKPFTLESAVFGLIFSLRAASTLIWLSSFNEIISNEKIIFLFGRLSPRTALVISMALRFIPLIASQAEEINSAQKGIGSGDASQSFSDRLKSGIKRLSILVTWTLERGIDTSDSMTARGFGLRKRTHYSRYIFSLRDAFLMLFSVAFIVLFILTGSSLSCEYFPSISIPVPDAFSFFSLIFFVIFMIFPLIYDTAEEKKWSNF